MDILNTLTVIGKRVLGRGLLVTRKYSPEILTTVGIVGGVVATGLAIKATMKVDAPLAVLEHETKQVREMRQELSEEQYPRHIYYKELLMAYGDFALDLSRLYWPAFTVGTSSIVCVIAAHGIMKRRNVALVAAYQAIEQTFQRYRHRVIEEFGAEKDEDFRRGIYRDKVTKTVDGKKKTETIIKQDPNAVSIYARFFDETCPDWQKTPERNLMFLKCKQNMLNDDLRNNGHLFLNEVYDELGIPRTQAGQVVGWVMGAKGDNFVDFGVYDLDSPKARDFVNGYERSILLDFNVDGVIIDLINKD